MSNIFDTFTESGRLLQEGYEKLIQVDYDPDCEMVQVINEYEDLPDLEDRIDKLKDAKEKINQELTDIEQEFDARLEGLKSEISRAEVTVLETQDE